MRIRASIYSLPHQPLFEISRNAYLGIFVSQIVVIMWTSIQNGRKRDGTVDKIRQYIKLTDQSSFSSKLSKSTVGTIRSESTNKKHDKQNIIFSYGNMQNQAKGILVAPREYSMNLFSRVQNNSVLKKEPNKKSQVRINYQKTNSILKIKKDGNINEQQVNCLIRQQTYFLECLKSPNNLKTQFHTNIHNSICTFRQFMPFCQSAKEKLPDFKIPSSTFGKKTIVFDMDETLIHTNQSPTTNFQIKVPFRSFQNKIGYGYVQVRPYAKEILVSLSQFFDIIIFTASTQGYADPIIDYLDPHRVVQYRLYRQSCSLIKNQVFVKDLRILGRALSSIVLVDNAPYSYMMQLDNGIPIIPYYKGKDDDQLLSLQNYLMKIKDVEDVRIVNSRHFKLHEYLKYDNCDNLIKNLYSEWIK